VYLAAQAGVSAEVTIVASVVEQVLTVGSELFVFLVLLPLWPAFPTSGLVVPLLAVSLGLIALHPRNIALVLSLAGRVLKRRIVVAPPGYRHLVFLFACYVAAAVVNGLACYLLVLSLGGSAQSWPVIVGGYLLARSLGFISFFTPAGIGVREGVLTALLTPLLSLPLATAASLWARVLSTAAEGAVVLFVIVVGKAGRRPSRWPRVGS
jgi:hypothetical protein